MKIPSETGHVELLPYKVETKRKEFILFSYYSHKIYKIRPSSNSLILGLTCFNTLKGHLTQSVIITKPTTLEYK